MRGTIEMTVEEFVKANDYLGEEYKKAIKNCDTYIRDTIGGWVGLVPDVGNYFALGGTATKLIASKYGLANYKSINYGIKIV